MSEDALARINREWREDCIKRGLYKGIDPESVRREEERWKKECSRPPKNLGKRPRKRPPKGHAD